LSWTAPMGYTGTYTLAWVPCTNSAMYTGCTTQTSSPSIQINGLTDSTVYSFTLTTTGTPVVLPALSVQPGAQQSFPFSLTLNVDAAAVNHTDFANTLLQDLATALGVPVNRLQLTNVAPGSLVVSFAVVSDPSNPLNNNNAQLSANAVAAALTAQLNNPLSPVSTAGFSTLVVTSATPQQLSTINNCMFNGVQVACSSISAAPATDDEIWLLAIHIAAGTMIFFGAWMSLHLICSRRNKNAYLHSE